MIVEASGLLKDIG